jgi:hypothetical protein
VKLLTNLRNHLTAIPSRDWCLIVIGGSTAVGVLTLPDALFPWLLVADLLAGCACLGVLYLESEHRLNREADANFDLRFDLAGAQQTVTRLESECNAQAAVSADLARRLAEAESTTVRVPLLRVVPARRDGSEYEWPAIVRAVEGETGGAS